MFPCSPSEDVDAGVLVEPASLRERSKAVMTLHGLGDAIGFKNGEFEHCRVGAVILSTVEELGGLSSIDLDGWRISDDTGLLGAEDSSDVSSVCESIAREYFECMSQMGGRWPGGTSTRGANRLGTHDWRDVPYNPRGAGCGGAMRACCIGLRYFGATNRDMLVAIGIESGRMTHNHPTGFLGSLTAASFTSFALEDIPSFKWGFLLMNEILPLAKEYIKKCQRDVDLILRDLMYFESHWAKFLRDRDLSRPDNPTPTFQPEMKGDVSFREKYWKTFSYSGWPGSSGHDSVLVAYDAILLGGNSYDDVLRYACWHGGDSDSTGGIAMGIFGAMHGFRGVHPINLANLEKRRELEYLGERLWAERCGPDTQIPVPTPTFSVFRSPQQPGESEDV